MAVHAPVSRATLVWALASGYVKPLLGHGFPGGGYCYGDVVRPDTGMTIGTLIEMYLSYDVCALDCVGIAVSTHVTCVI